MGYSLSLATRLQPTEKLFLADPYQQVCTATILHTENDYVVVDSTLFYAESGGQASDQGWIDDIEVVDVQKYLGDQIYPKRQGLDVPAVKINTVLIHKVGVPGAFKVGQQVTLRIDWNRRYLHMRNHGAAHFLYYAARKLYEQASQKMITQGCSIRSESSRFDLFPKLEPSELWSEASQIANSLLSLGLDITMEPDSLTNEVAYWTYGDIVIPCGGTHVRNAVEIGPIRVKRSSQGKSLDRVYAYLEETS